MSMLELGIVSDEIDPDFAVALRHGTSWGVRKYEIRVLRSGRVPQVDPKEWEEVAAAARSGRCEITALSPGIFKQTLSRRGELDAELSDTLPRTIELARQCGARLVIAFGFHREVSEPADHFRLAVQYMREAASLASKAGMRIAIENEPGFWCDTGRNTAHLIREVSSPALGANWDPCNAFGTLEVPFPDGYEALKGAIINVHAKDTLAGSLIKCVPIGEGAIDWKGQMAALLRDSIVQHVTIETHCHPLVENSERNVKILRRYMQEA